MFTYNYKRHFVLLSQPIAETYRLNHSTGVYILEFVASLNYIISKFRNLMLQVYR